MEFTLNLYWMVRLFHVLKMILCDVNFNKDKYVQIFIANPIDNFMTNVYNKIVGNKQREIMNE